LKKAKLVLAVALFILATSATLLGYSIAAMQFQGKVNSLEKSIDKMLYAAEVISVKDHVEASLYFAQAAIEDKCIIESIENVLKINLNSTFYTKNFANIVFLKKLKNDLKSLNETIPPEGNSEINRQLLESLKNYVENYELYIVFLENNTSCNKLKALLPVLNSNYNKISVIVEIIAKNIVAKNK